MFVRLAIAASLTHAKPAYFSDVTTGAKPP
jgi:hypothetical protein